MEQIEIELKELQDQQKVLHLKIKEKHDVCKEFIMNKLLSLLSGVIKNKKVGSIYLGRSNNDKNYTFNIQIPKDEVKHETEWEEQIGSISALLEGGMFFDVLGSDRFVSTEVWDDFSNKVKELDDKADRKKLF